MGVELSLSEAAEAVGKDPSTLSRAVKSGRLSCQKDANGQRVFDPAELMRVYGEFQTQDEEVVRTSASADACTSTHEGDARLEPAESAREDARVHELELVQTHLRARVRDLEDRVDDLQTERERWQREASDWKEQAQHQTRLLTDERERHVRQEAELVEQGRARPSRWPQVAALAAVVIAVAGFGVAMYPQKLVELAAFESVSESGNEHPVDTSVVAPTAVGQAGFPPMLME